MKLLHLVAAAMFSSASLFGQTLIDGSFTSQTNSDTIVIQSEAYFGIGSLGSCPPLTEHYYNENNGLLEVNLFYNSEGAWPQLGCNQSNTLEITNITGVNSIIVCFHEITANGTINDIDCDTMSLSLSSTLTVENEFSIYPNPTSSNITIESQENGQITFYNILGENVFSVEKSKYRQTINTQSFSKGVYFLKLNNQTFRVVKE